MSVAKEWLRERDWEGVRIEYESSTPYNCAVLDEFLNSDRCNDLRRALLNQWGWHYKSPYAKELYLKQPELPEVAEIAGAVKEKLPSLFGDSELVDHWAFLHHENHGLVAHSDVGSVSIDLWLTPDEHNNDPGSGGLILYDVKRPPALSVFEFQVRQWTREYLSRWTSGMKKRIAYAHNRAVIFDAHTLHASDEINFGDGRTETCRVNFSLLFEDPNEHSTRLERYGRRFAVMERLARERGIDMNSADLETAEWLWADAGKE